MYQYYALSDQGKSRSHQEDDWRVIPELRLVHSSSKDGNSKIGSAFIVADGMGGAIGGEIASQTAVNEITRFLESANLIDEASDIEVILKNAIESANVEIRKIVSSNMELTGMGSTVVLALLYGDDLNVCWIGDSRCYLFRQSDGLLSVSKDHSYVQKLVDQGILSSDQALHHPNKNIILQSLGQEKINCEFVKTKMIAEDIILLCSDGLNSMLSDGEIEDVLKNPSDIKSKAELLVNLANEKGGHDNITVILIKYNFSLKNSIILHDKNIKKKILPGTRKKLLWAGIATLLLIPLLLLIGYYYHSPKNDLSEKTNDSEAIQNIIMSNDAGVVPQDENIVNSIEKYKFYADFDSVDVLIKNGNAFSSRYEIRLAVFEHLSEANEDYTKYSSEYPEYSFELRKGKGGLVELYITQFESKQLAEDFLRNSRNENAVILFNKYSNNK